MKQLRYLKDATILQCTFTKNDIGETLHTYTSLNTYPVYMNDTANDLRSSNSGADIRNIVRISSVRNELEQYLYNLMNYSDDNASKYRILLNNKVYSIVAVKETYVDIKYV